MRHKINTKLHDSLTAAKCRIRGFVGWLWWRWRLRPLNFLCPHNRHFV